MLMKSKIVLLFWLVSCSCIFACDCESEGGFLKVAPLTPFVALVKVSKYLTFKDIHGTPTPMSMEIEIIDIYKGKESRKKVIVWGDDGAMCRPYLSRFEMGKYYVIAFEGSQVGDYSISICGEYWLTVSENMLFASGILMKQQDEIKLTDLKRSLK